MAVFSGGDVADDLPHTIARSFDGLGSGVSGHGREFVSPISAASDHRDFWGKRLGWLATAVFLEINDIAISRASNDDVYDLVIDVAANQPTVETIAERLRQLAT